MGKFLLSISLFIGLSLTAFAAEAQMIARPLSDEDATRYTRIFDLQKSGKWDAADREMVGLHDQVLMGYVLRQRYMHPSYRSSFKELSSWLELYEIIRIRLKFITSPRRAAQKGQHLPAAM